MIADHDTAELGGKPAESPFYTAEHEAFRDTVRRWVKIEIEPYASEWDEAGTFPRELYVKASEFGLLQLGFPEVYGGLEVDGFYKIISSQEIARAGSGGIAASLFSHTIGCPPILFGGSEVLKARVIPGVLQGEKISALAVTEPDGGSDVAAIKTTARREGDHYIVKGTKTFVTSGTRADYITVAVRTDSSGRNGLSVLLVEADSPA